MDDNQTPTKTRWPGIKELVYFGPQGILYLVGFMLVIWGVFGYWPPTASNSRVMLGFAFVSWARGAHFWRQITYFVYVASQPSRTTTKFSIRGFLRFSARSPRSGLYSSFAAFHDRQESAGALHVSVVVFTIPEGPQYTLSNPPAEADPALAFFLETAVESSSVISVIPGSGRRGSLAGSR